MLSFLTCLLLSSSAQAVPLQITQQGRMIDSNDPTVDSRQIVAEETSTQKTSVKVTDSIYVSGTTIGKGQIATEVSLKHHTYLLSAYDTFGTKKSRYPYTLSRYGIFDQSEIQIHIGIESSCFHAEGYTPDCSFGDTISFSEGEKFLGIGFKKNVNIGTYVSAYIHAHKDIQNWKNNYGGFGVQVKVGPLTSSLNTPFEYKNTEYSVGEILTGYSVLLELESANRIQVVQTSTKNPIQIDLLGIYSIPLLIRETSIEEAIKYESNEDDIGFVYVSNNFSYEGGVGVHLEKLGLYISTTLYSNLYFEIHGIINQSDLERARALDFNQYIAKNNGYHIMISKTW
jgi:hypothetical protein